MAFLITRWRLLLTSASLCLALAAAAPPEEWESSVTSFSLGSFPESRPVRVQYSFGWAGMSAATGDIRLQKLSTGFQLEATGGTVGFARALWRYDLRHTALADKQTLRPIRVLEIETTRKKQTTTEVTFSPESATSVCTTRKASEVTTATRRFDFPNALSLNSALLFLHTQALPDGAIRRLVVYPATSAYLCTLTVIGRERITVASGTYDAIKLDVHLNKIGPDRALLPHKKFRTATVWLSDDADRLPLRVEAQVFIGKVFAELQSAQFDQAKP